jgi:hypothetical protein
MRRNLSLRIIAEALIERPSAQKRRQALDRERIYGQSSRHPPQCLQSLIIGKFPERSAGKQVKLLKTPFFRDATSALIGRLSEKPYRPIGYG